MYSVLSWSVDLVTAPPSNINFTITAEIHARLLVNFYCEYADRHMNLKVIGDASASESGQFDNLLLLS